MGRHIVRALLDGGHDVAVLSRNPAKIRSIRELDGAGGVQGDATDPTSLRGTLESADAVVAAVQFPNHPMEVPRRGLTYDRYDRQGTENLLAEAERAGVERFMYLSGAGADVTSDRTWYRAKGFAEQAIERSDISHFILRPSWAYGPGDRALNRFALMARLSPVVVVPGTQPQLIQPVFVGDMAEAFRRALERDGVWNQTFEIGSRATLTMHQVVETLLEVMGKKRAIVHLPLGLLKVATAPLVALPKPPMTPHGLDFATQDGLVDVEPLVDALGFEPLPLAEGLRTYF
jgi:NADH dehydrogenase